MESELEKVADEIMLRNEQVKGILCADESGLNVCDLGTLSNTAGDVSVDLLKLANNLEPGIPMSSVVIHFTGIDGSSLSIAKDGPLTTVVHRVDEKK